MARFSDPKRNQTSRDEALSGTVEQETEAELWKNERGHRSSRRRMGTLRETGRDNGRDTAAAMGRGLPARCARRR
jgi:hypothetical protein